MPSFVQFSFPSFIVSLRPLVFKFFQAGSTAVAFLYQDHLSFVVQTIICGVGLVIGIACLCWVEYRHYQSDDFDGNSIFKQKKKKNGGGIEQEGSKSPLIHEA